MSTSEHDDLLLFTPVPARRVTANGWSAEVQRAFVAHLAKHGVVSAAARSVGRTARSAWMLRKRDGADGFAKAWDQAADEGRRRAYDDAVHRLMQPRVRPVFYKGEKIGERAENNDRLLLAALQAMATRKIVARR